MIATKFLIEPLFAYLIYIINYYYLLLFATVNSIFYDLQQMKMENLLLLRPLSPI